VALRAIKQAEDSDAYVVRFYETAGQGAQKAQVRFAADIVEAKELNGNEEEIGAASATGNTLSFEIGSYGMKTYLVRLAKPQAPAAVASAAVVLPYNMKTASFNAFRTEVNFDGKGNAYAAELLPEILTFKGIEFRLNDPATANGVKCRQDTVSLPAGNYNKLYLLAAATRHDTKATFVVGDKEQEVVVPYYGGFIGQWGHTGHTEELLKAADIAFVGTHKHSMVHNKDLAYDYAYMFCIPLDIPAGATSFVLPANQQIVIFAATAVNDVNNAAVPCSDLMKIGMEASSEGETVESYVNLCLKKPVVGRSAEVNRREMAEFAVDDNVETKWCDVSGAKPKFIEVDLQKQTTVRGWYVLHAGMEKLDYITKEYSLQVRNSMDEEWKTVDTVYDNLELDTERLLKEPVQARYVRLNVTKPDQSEGNTVRIYEFVVF
jgi:alpha-mannosidase